MDSLLMQELKKQFEGKKILVVGLGLQGGGVGLVKFFSKLGALVSATDLKTERELAQSINTLSHYQVKYTLGQHQSEDFLLADFIFKGPSVPWELPELVEAQNKGITIDMEGSFFAAHCPALIIGVTGTRGKTTTSYMIYESLKQTTSNVHLAGNISDTSTVELLSSIKKDDVVVLELSSWQLSGFHKRKISPHISVFTNFYPDHLNYYASEDEYFKDKSAIYAYQKRDDFLIANKQLAGRLNKAQIRSTTRFFSRDDFPNPLTRLHGEHNRENAAAALMVNEILGNDLKMASKIISQFRGVSYRQEIVGVKSFVTFINDSTSTTPISTIKALEAFSVGRTVLILGGDSKNLPFGELVIKLGAADYIILLTGTFTDEIYSILLKKYPSKVSEPFKDLKSALHKAFEVAKNFKQKTYLLFSPGATSFSMFENEFDRGKQFNEIVSTL